jgi:hypothetical protein
LLLIVSVLLLCVQAAQQLRLLSAGLQAVQQALLQ